MATKWKANVVRLSTNQDYWLASSAYIATVQQQVEWVTSLGMGIIIDLHWNQGGQQVMADENSITYWAQVAAAYKSNPWVIFELYNEPHDIPWSVWQKGNGTWAGMQQLYDAVRTTGGANNLVIINGLNWAFDLSGVPDYPITGTNIAYGTHPYDDSGKQLANWPAAFGYLAATAPVILTEFGQYCNSDNYVQQLLQYVDSLQLHWTVWAWYVNGCSFPSIINDWTGTPLAPVGPLVFASLTGNTSYSAGTGGSSEAVTPATSALIVYADSLENGFEDWSWSTDYSLDSTTYVHSGSNSIEFDVDDYEGIYFHNPSTNFVLEDYTSIQFYVNGGTASVPGSALIVEIYDSSATQVGNTVAWPVGASPGTWTLVSIATSAFGVAASTEISGIALASNEGPNDGNIWIDDVSLQPAASGTSAATVATTAASSVTTAATHATTAATTAATHATTAATTAAATVGSTVTTGGSAGTSGSAACGASSIVFTQTAGTSWQQSESTITQWTLTISTTCTTHTLVALAVTASNWNPIGSWGATVSGNTLTLPSYTTITSSSPYTGVGYQNEGTSAATFTVLTFTFQ